MNVLIQPVSGSIYFDNNLAGSSSVGTGNVSLTYNTSGGLTISSSNSANSLRLAVSGSQGNLFSVYDSLTGQIFAVNKIGGTPVLEVYDNDTVKLGTYLSNTLLVSGTQVSIGGTPIAAAVTPKLSIYGTTLATGSVSSANLIYDGTGNSSQWNSTFTTVCAFSAGWGTGGTANLGQIPTLSANWNASYTTLTANSANWNSSYTTLTANSANWNASYTTLTANSANWNSSYTTLTANSANWNSSYTAVNGSSATWFAEGLMPVSITTNSTVGGLTQGTVFTANTPLSTIIQRMIVAAIPAVYTYPTLSASTSAFAFEIGTSITPIISAVWTQNDAGSATSYTILSSFSYNTGYTSITSVTGFNTAYNISSLSSISLSPFYLLSTIYFETSATYAQGPQKQDNYGNNSGTPIPAYFIVSSAFSLSAYRKGFYSADTSTWSLSDSNAVRSLTNTVIVPSSFNVTVPTGATRFVFAYPSVYALTIRNPGSTDISPANGYNANTSLFTTSGVQVYGANNLSLTGYRVFAYVGTPPVGTYSITASQPASSVSYTSPSLPALTITTTTPLCSEIGTLSAINFNSSYTNNDGGGITAYAVLTSWDNTTYTQITAVNTTQTSFTVATPFVSLSSNSYNPSNTFYIQTSATYSTGPVKYNTYNDLNATGQIQASSTTRTTNIAVSAFRRLFYAFDIAVTTPSDSASVRALTGIINNPQLGNTYTFTQAQIPTGLKRMVFAYPSYAGPITTAQDTTNNFSYLPNLTLTTVSVSGANGQYPINYNVYTYIAGGTFGNFNFTLTI